MSRSSNLTLSRNPVTAVFGISLNTINPILFGLFVLGAVLRTLDIGQPIGVDDLLSWRETDIGGIARNFYREGMNLFYPRIDWRGDGPGYVEMEFPLYPWLIAVFYQLFGYHEIFGRLLSYSFSLGAMAVFFLLARYLLPPVGAVFAALFFVLSPLAIKISNSLQPEGLMFLCYLLAAYAFIRWIDDNSWKHYGLALFATSLCILAKAPAAHIGLFFALLVLKEKGLVAFRQIRLWAFAIVALVPVILWYKHAQHLWLTYGNSLGVSNENHVAGWKIFTHPSLIRGIFNIELWHVWMPTGLIICAIGILVARSEKAAIYSLYWLLAIFAFYLVIAYTTSAGWAIYYHIFSVPPVALLIGLGVEALIAVNWGKNLTKNWLPQINTPVVVLAVVCLSGTFLFQGLQIYQSTAHGAKNIAKIYQCAQEFKPAIADNGLIATTAPGILKNGRPVASNVPYMFYWLDRKGFNLFAEKHSLKEVMSLAKRGARYLIAEKGYFKGKPQFESDLRRTFPAIRECKQAVLFELTPKLKK
jgi:flagellar biosynthesis protein FliQ